MDEVETTNRPKCVVPVTLARESGYLVRAVIFTPNGPVNWLDVCKAYDADERASFLKKLVEYCAEYRIQIDKYQTHLLERELLKIAEEQIRDKEQRRDRTAHSADGQGQDLEFPDVLPWDEPVRLAEVLEEIVYKIGRYVWVREEALWTAALWAAWTWVFDRFDVAPILFITSATHRCGKTRLLECLSAIVRRPLVATPSPASLFRTIELCRPTFVLDEVDNLVKESEEWRLLLNAGHTKRTASVIRSVGDDFKPRRFSTWCPKALGGIGDLAVTTSDRAIILRLTRKPPDVEVTRLTSAELRTFHPLARKLARWALDSIDPSSPPEWPVPDAPPGLDDRAADNWGPLLAIADMAGGEWPEKAREAAVLISADTREEKDVATQLVRDSFLAFGEDEELSAAELIDRLCSDSLSPWSTFSRGGKPISPKRLAQMLGRFSIRPAHTRKGNFYRRADLEPVIKAYFPTLLGFQSFTSFTQNVSAGKIETYGVKDSSEDESLVL